MFIIIKHQIQDGMKDARFLFLGAIVLIAFIINGLIYAEKYNDTFDDWQSSIASEAGMIDARSDNLTALARYYQTVVKPPSVLAFVVDGGNDKLPNTMSVNAFIYRNPDRQNRGNEMLSDFPSVDWVFIIGTVMSLQAFMLGFRSVCGEKRDGTLSLLLSYPVSRSMLFFGKYLGFLAILVITFIVGATVDLSILFSSGVLHVDSALFVTLGWIFVIAVLFISLLLLLGIAVSSFVRVPAVALVILMIIWLFGVIAVPGLARIIGENMVDVPSESDVNREVGIARRELWDNAPEGAGAWQGNNEYRFSEPARRRAELYQAITASTQNIINQADSKHTKQAELINSIASISPVGLLNDAMQRLSERGIYGYKSLRETARRYQLQLYSLVEEVDSTDSDSPHNLYHGVEQGGFSTKPVEMSAVPRSHTLWQAGRASENNHVPWIHMSVLLATNLLMLLIAFVALLRYDPR